MSVSIRPKLAIDRVLFLASYAMGAFELRDMDRFDFPEAPTLVEVLALALAAAARRTFTAGLVHGYRIEEEAAHTVRGRIRIEEQIRRRFGVPVPIEVRYDEFTDDVVANRLVKAAAARLGKMRLRSTHSRDGLRWIAARLDNVLLAYATALDLPGGLLIYAEGEAEPMTHNVRHAGKRLEVTALDLSGSPAQLLARVGELACHVRALRLAATRMRLAA